jgi:hypothetical protein
MVASGRMGNTMFEFASTYGIARSKGMKLLVPENFYLLKIFKLKVDVYKMYCFVATLYPAGGLT